MGQTTASQAEASSQEDESSAAAGQTESQDKAAAASTQTGQEVAPSLTIKVDVEGCVAKPGVYELEGDARVVDAVKAAGGLTKKAAKGKVNLASKIEDGSQVYIPSSEELDASSGAGGSSTGVSSAASASSGSGDKINLNTATAEQLEELPGVGPVLAASIVEYREQEGSFASIEDLKNVSGIGDTRFARLKDLVCV